MKRIALTFSLVAISVVALAGGPWVPGKKKGFFKLEQRWIISDQLFNNDGETIDIRETGVFFTTVYAEYGLGKRWGVTLNAPVFVRHDIAEQRENLSQVSNDDELNGIGDINLSINYQLIKKDAFALAASFTYGFATGEVAGGNTELLQTGDGEDNQLLKLDAGYSFYPKPLYVAAGVGFNNRTEDFSDEFHFSAEAGYTVNNFTAALKIYAVRSFENGDAGKGFDNPEGTTVFANNTEFIGIGPEFSYTFKEKYGLSFNVQGAFASRNILAAPSFAVGGFFKL